MPQPRNQRDNQKSYIEEGQTIQWSKEKRIKGLAMIYKTLHRKLKTNKHEPH
jgi:hypothetical protein